MEQIDVNRNMADLIHEYPHLGMVLSELGIECVDCLASCRDTLQDVIHLYHLDKDNLLQQLKQASD